MPQEFHVVRCFKCEIFQVDIMKKAKKWTCKLCGESQSLMEKFGEGTSKDCRRTVQKLNIEMKNLETLKRQHLYLKENSCTDNTNKNNTEIIKSKWINLIANDEEYELNNEYKFENSPLSKPKQSNFINDFNKSEINERNFYRSSEEFVDRKLNVNKEYELNKECKFEESPISKRKRNNLCDIDFIKDCNNRDHLFLKENLCTEYISKDNSKMIKSKWINLIANDEKYELNNEYKFENSPLSKPKQSNLIKDFNKSEINERNFYTSSEEFLGPKLNVNKEYVLNNENQLEDSRLSKPKQSYFNKGGINEPNDLNVNNESNRTTIKSNLNQSINKKSNIFNDLDNIKIESNRTSKWENFLN